MLDARKRALMARFGAADTYDQAAHIQRRCAQLTANTIAATGQHTPKNILEFGCGTGFLTHHIRQLFPHASILATDLAPGMLARAETQLGSNNIRYHMMDGENPDVSGPFDLIASSLCMQWFQNRPQALERLCARLAPNGRLIVATLLSGSLQEWVNACAAEHAPCGVPHYPTEEQLTQDWPSSIPGERHWQSHDLIDPTPSASAFLRGLRQIGASLPRDDARPATGAALRRAMKRFDAEHKGVTYRIGIGIFHKGHTA
ncbi:methyltransferase [Neokomagataea thailandica]|nr:MULTISPECIES: methyltransferase [Neokomagataea]